MRLVFDTNALVSAMIIETSESQKAYFRAIVGGNKILYSFDTLAELEQVVQRSKFNKYLSVEKREKFVYDYLLIGESVEITRTVAACRDPKDDKFLELAICGKADYIISGDKDLLELNPFRFIEIITPSTFLQKINL
jgi:putative PIN family toxin of toxin-antitoxin system